MPIDPSTGQIMPYSQEVVEQPLVMRMIENMPGLSASIGFSSGRGANTLVRGGFLDDTKIEKLAARRAKYGVFQLKDIEAGQFKPTVTTEKSFLFGKRRFGKGTEIRNRAGQLKDPFFKQARVNNVTLRPRVLSRFHSLSVFTSTQNSGLYTYAQGHRLLNMPKVGKFFGMNQLRAAAGVEGEAAVLGPGVIAAISAGRKFDLMTKRGALSEARLNKFGTTIQRLATSNNASLLAAKEGTTFAKAAAMTSFERRRSHS
jgi:hypothetical protein